MKFHRFNHQTYQDPSIPDAGRDQIAAHENPWRGDMVLSAGSGVLSARDIRTNNIQPFSGNWTYFPQNVFITNLSSISATVNYQNILITELSGFRVDGSDTSIHIHDISLPGSNDLSINHAPISSNSWVSIVGDLQTQNDLYVLSTAYIKNEYVSNNLTAVNLSGLNIQTYNLTGVNNYFTNENVVNSHITNLTATNLSAFNTSIYNLSSVNNNFTNVTVSNCLSTNCIWPYTAGESISSHGNIDMLGYSISGIGNASLSFQSGAKISSPSNGLQVSTNNSARMTIISAGDVGIGTITPNEKLTVVGNISANGNVIVNSLTSFGGLTVPTDLSYAGTYGDTIYDNNGVIRFTRNDATTQYTSGAKYWLTSLGSSEASGNPSFTIRSAGSDDYLTDPFVYMLLGRNVGSYATGYEVLLDPYRAGGTFVGGNFKTNSNSYLAVSAGNVGIGTDIPNEKLTVIGNISATGNLTANDITFTGMTTIDSNVTTLTASNLFATLTINGSAFAMPLYRYN